MSEHDRNTETLERALEEMPEEWFWSIKFLADTTSYYNFGEEMSEAIRRVARTLQLQVKERYGKVSHSDDVEEPTASDPYRFARGGLVPVDMITALSGLDANKRDSLRSLADHASNAEEFRDSLYNALSLVDLIKEGED